MATQTNKSTSYQEMIKAYDQFLERGHYLFTDDRIGHESDYETWDDDDDYCNEANCC